MIIAAGRHGTRHDQVQLPSVRAAVVPEGLVGLVSPVHPGDIAVLQFRMLDQVFLGGCEEAGQVRVAPATMHRFLRKNDRSGNAYWSESGTRKLTMVPLGAAASTEWASTRVLWPTASTTKPGLSSGRSLPDQSTESVHTAWSRPNADTSSDRSIRSMPTTRLAPRVLRTSGKRIPSEPSPMNSRGRVRDAPDHGLHRVQHGGERLDRNANHGSVIEDSRCIDASLVTMNSATLSRRTAIPTARSPAAKRADRLAMTRPHTSCNGAERAAAGVLDGFAPLR